MAMQQNTVTSTGTYRFNTGFYGLNDMPTEIQKTIDITLSKLTNTFIFRVSGGGIQIHKDNLFKCLDRLEENLAINLDKCHFAKQKIAWLGYEINDKGIKPIATKTQAILNLKHISTSQLESYLEKASLKMHSKDKRPYLPANRKHPFQRQ